MHPDLTDREVTRIKSITCPEKGNVNPSGRVRSLGRWRGKRGKRREKGSDVSARCRINESTDRPAGRSAQRAPRVKVEQEVAIEMEVEEVVSAACASP